MITAHSQPVARLGSKLDYLGITILITGSFFPSVYYGFYCFPHLQKIYWTMVSFNIETRLIEDLVVGDYTHFCYIGR